MKLKVNPTRMELLKLKRSLKTAKKGHKLLKEKRDGLMKEFMEIIRIARSTRSEMEEKLANGFHAYTLASANMTDMAINSASCITNQKMSIDFDVKNVMSVKIPKISFETKGDYISYGFQDTSAELDIALKKLQESLPILIRLAEIEKSAQKLAAEIEKTRRRVNALEHVMIPNLEETIKYIQMKLGEQERSTITTTMRVKELIESQA